jgi:hypothetical protein
MSKADAKRNAIEAKQLINQMMTENSTIEIEELTNEIVALVISASETRIAALNEEADKMEAAFRAWKPPTE